MKKIELDGKAYNLSALPLVGLAKIGNNLEKIGSDFSEEGIAALIDGVYFGLKRNHPEIEREFVEWSIDTTNLKEVLSAFIEVNKVPGANTGKPAARKSKTGN